MTKDELKALAKAMPRADEPTQPVEIPSLERTRTVYSLIQQGGGWVLTRHDVPVSVLEGTEVKGSRVGPEILGIVLHRLEEAIMRQDGMWRV